MNSTQRKAKAIYDWLTQPVAEKQYPDCEHCDNGRKTANDYLPIGPDQCKTGPTGKCKCGRYLCMTY